MDKLLIIDFGSIYSTYCEKNKRIECFLRITPYQSYNSDCLDNKI